MSIKEQPSIRGVQASLPARTRRWRLQGQGPGHARSEVAVRPLSGDAPSRRPLEEPQLQEEGLDDILDRVGLLPHRGRKRREPHRPPAELLHDAAKDRVVETVEALLVDLE